MSRILTLLAITFLAFTLAAPGQAELKVTAGDLLKVASPRDRGRGRDNRDRDYDRRDSGNYRENRRNQGPTEPTWAPQFPNQPNKPQPRPDRHKPRPTEPTWAPEFPTPPNKPQPRPRGPYRAPGNRSHNGFYNNGFHSRFQFRNWFGLHTYNSYHPYYYYRQNARFLINPQDGSIWVSAAQNLSLGLFFEYKKFLLTPSARIDTSIRAIFTTVSHDVVARARANPSLNGAELERLTFMVFQNFVNTQVGSISLANGLYSMRLNNNRGKTDNWVSTPIRDADMGAIIQSVPPSFLANPGAGWQVFFPGQNLGAI